MIALLLGNDPAPATYVVGGRYALGVEVDGMPPARALYSIGRRTEAKLSFVDRAIFEPVGAEPYYLHVQADSLDGTIHEAIFILSVTATGASADRVTITWSEPAPRNREHIHATIGVSRRPQSIGWSLLYNNVPVQSGDSSVASVPIVNPGIYRVVATVVDRDGNTVIGDSSLVVPSPYGVQAVVTPVQPSDATLYHIGDVYSPLIEGDAIQCAYLPYELTNISSVLKLVPGTTHFRVELDPVHADVDDEVIVRTAHGNWTLKGPPDGLSSERMPYDYRHGQPVQPAALDLSVRYAIEALNVHGSVANAYKFRVVFRCYRAGSALFRYVPCDWSAYYGGRGERQRRIIALITNVDVILDAEWPDNRLGSRNLEPFTAPDQKRVVGQFNITGNPDRPLYQEDHFYTDQNAAARYESPTGNLNDLTISCTYGLPSVRPCYLDFSQPAHPRIIQRLKRLYGKLVVYVAGGGLPRGTYVHVRIYTGKSPGYVIVSVPVPIGVYNPDYSSYAKVGEADISVPDFEFDRVGVLMDLRVDETVASADVAAYDPMHQVAESAYYSNISAPAIKVDTACFRDPVPVAVFDGTFAGSAVPLPDCNRLPCGPVGIYCYTNSTTGTIPPALNTPPVADPQSLSTQQDTPLAVTLTATDAETPFSLSFAVTSGPAHGAISGNSSPPNIIYTPDSGYVGSDAFTFLATDPGFLSGSAQVSISVTHAPPVNTPPTAFAQAVTTPQNTALPITLTGIDAETPFSLVYATTIAPLHGNLAGSPPNVTYTPNLGYTGPDSFTFSVTDPGFLSNSALVSITVTPVAPPNTPPTANPQNLSLNQDASLPVTLTGTDIETPGSLVFAVTSGPFHGHLTGTAPNVTYVPNPGYVGPDSFSFSVTDPGSLSGTAVVTLTVNHVNHTPAANAQSVSLTQDTSLGITLTGSDPDGDGLTFSVTVPPGHGGLSGSAPNVTYTPDTGYAGPDSFQFTVTDNGTPPLTSSAATVVIAVNSTSPVFYGVIGGFNPDSSCDAFATGGVVHSISTLDSTQVLFELVSTKPLPVVIPVHVSAPVFLVRMDQRFLDTVTDFGVALDVITTIVFELFYDRWLLDDTDTFCLYSSTYHFAMTAQDFIAAYKSQQNSAEHAGTLEDPFVLFSSPS